MVAESVGLAASVAGIVSLGLQILGQNIKTLTAVGSSSQGIFSELSLVRSGVAAMETPIVKINDEVRLLRADVHSNNQLAVSQYNNILNCVQVIGNDALRNAQETNERWAQLQSTSDLEMAKRCEEIMNNLTTKMRKDIGQMLEDFQRKDIQVPVRAGLIRGLPGKPALLKTLSDEVSSLAQRNDQVAEFDLRTRTPQNTAGPVSLPDPSGPIRGTFCTCPRLRTLTKRKRIHLAGACFSREVETTSHWPTCPMVKMKQARRTVLGIKYDGLVSFLNKAISLSFAMKSGAGPFDISPNFTCIPTVDEEFDPAFRIVSLIGEGLVALEARKAEAFLKACTTRLSRLLDGRKVCAAAVDRQNMGLMHYLIMALDELQPSYYASAASVEDRRALRSLLVDLVRMLLSYGVPAFALDLEGASPLANLSVWFFGDMISQGVIDLLVRANSEDQPLILNPEREYAKVPDGGDLASFPFPTITVKHLYNMSLGFAEVSECGPLSMAIIRNDADGVERILDCTPGLISEIDVFGQTPFHLAAANPPILEILLRYCHGRILDRRDMSGFTAFEIAMAETSHYCDNGNNTKRCDPSKCGCCQCVDLFMGGGCDVRMHALTSSDHAPELGLVLTEASELARRKYVYHMKRMRDSASRGPSPSLHGLTKSKTTHSRMELEVNQPGRNITGSDQLRPPITATDTTDDISWVFLETNAPHIGALFYRHGFRPHPSSLDHLRPDFSSSFGPMSYFYLHWLVSHGVDLYVRSSKGPALSKDCPNIGLFGAHFAFYFISLSPRITPLFWAWRQEIWYWSTYMEIVTAVCRQNLTDGCECHCTVDGCSPFTFMMKGSFGSGTWNSPKDRDRMVKTIMEHYRRCDFELTLVTYKAAIRYATFEALGLVHTCCNASSLINHGKWVERDDVHIVNEEQAPLLKTFEAMVEDFEDIALQFVEVDSDGGSPFAMFWDLYWKRQIEEELETLEGNELTDAERRGSEEIGVQWTVSSLEQGVENGNPYSRLDPERWFYELDKICPEYAEPWPDEWRRFTELS